MNHNNNKHSSSPLTSIKEHQRKLIPSLSQRNVDIESIKALRELTSPMSMDMKNVLHNKLNKARKATISQGNRKRVYYDFSSLINSIISNNNDTLSYQNPQQLCNTYLSYNKHDSNNPHLFPSQIIKSKIERNAISCIERSTIKKAVNKINNSINTQSAFFDRFHHNSNANMIYARSHNNLELSENINDHHSKNHNRNTSRNINKVSSEKNLKKLSKVDLQNLIPPVIRYSHNIQLSSINNDRDIFKSFDNNKNRHQSNTTRKFIPYKFHTIKMTIQHPPKTQEFLKKCLTLKIESKNNIHLLFKMKCLKWLWTFKALIIEKFIYSYINFNSFLMKYEEMERKRFEEFLILIGIGKDDEFCDQIYSIHDPYKIKKTFNVKECFFFFIITSNSSYEKKITMLFNVIDDNKEKNTINENGKEKDNERSTFIGKLFYYFDITMNNNDYQTCYSIIKKIIKEDHYSLCKEDILKQLYNCQSMKKFLDKYYKNFINIDSQMQDEMNKTLNTRICNSLKFIEDFRVKSYIPFNYKQLKSILKITKEAKTIRDEIHQKQSTELTILTNESIT